MAAVVLLLVTAHFLGVLQRFGDPQGLARTLVELGPWGYAAFIAAYTILQPFGVPGTVFVMAAPLIWPWPEAFALSMVGTMSASVVGFMFARLVARDWISKWIPERFRKYEAALESRGFTTVAVLRFLFWMPPLLHAFFGVSRVGFWAHFWGSLLGYLVPLFVVSYFGPQIFELLQQLPLEAWLAS
ncbi:MAG TPA: VTT domain-containing protein, partial [Polyangiaceae bacterium]|nr:VTT domain-containing protein [Polyangiaceae bacterium]